MNGLACNTQDRSRYVWEVWRKLQNTCGHFVGMDSGGRGLCSHDKNNGTLEQERGCLRCGLPFCHYGDVVEKQVRKIIAKNNRENQKHIIPVMHDAAPTQRDPAKVIDITTFVSPDAVNYAKESARV